MIKSNGQLGSLLPNAEPKLLSGRLLARNTLWNFGGLVAPLLIALVAIPILIHGMGKERFGLLGIVWMGVGYFSLFDMGLGRALTKLIAERLGRNQTSDLPEIIWTALWLMSGLGIAGAIIGMLTAEPLIVHLLKVPAELRDEGVMSFRLLAASIPIVIATAALIGTLEAHQRFATIASVRVPLGVMTFLGPVISLHFTPSLVGATAIMVVTRVVAFMIYYASAAHVSPALKHPMTITRKHIYPLLSFGGWITVSNIISPLMGYIDRFFVGAMLSLTAVAYYITPYDMLSRIQMLPQAIMGVLFPAFTTALERERARLPELYDRMIRIMFFLVLPIMSGAFLFAPELLQLWLGSEFRIAATPVVRWLALGWTISIIGNAAFTVLQSAGRPDLTAKVHAVLLPVYVVVLLVFTKYFGITGTAMAWCLRVLIQTIILNELVKMKLPDLSTIIWWTYKAAACVLAGFALAWLIEPLLMRGLLFILIVIASSVFFLPFLKSWRRAEQKVVELVR